MKKKILSTLLAMTMTFGCTIPAAAISIYTPVEDDDESSYEMSENIHSIGSDASMHRSVRILRKASTQSTIPKTTVLQTNHFTQMFMLPKHPTFQSLFLK